MMTMALELFRRQYDGEEQQYTTIKLTFCVVLDETNTPAFYTAMKDIVIIAQMALTSSRTRK